MNRRMVVGAGLAMMSAALLFLGCKTAEKAGVKDITVQDAASLQQSGAAFFDANTDDFRKANGKVPGATLLASSHDYEVASTLPKDKDKQLVFYCTSKL